MPSTPIRVFAGIAAACIFLICFFCPRRPGMEEAGVFNAVYTYAHFGKMSFPVYGSAYFDSFGIHPHLHYAILGLLIRFGLTLYSAEGVVIFAISAIAIGLLLKGAFPFTVKLGFLLGIFGSIVF